MRITQSLLSWRSFHGNNIQSPLRCRAWAFLLSAAAILTLLLSTASSSLAASAKWRANPFTGNWNDPINWTVGGPPNGPADTATFNTSTKTALSLSLNTEVNRTAFKAGASGFTIIASPTFTFTLSGVGITNNSGITQNFVSAVDGAGNTGVILFTNSATAGSLTTFTNNGSTLSGAFGGTVFFSGTSTAGSGTFTNNGTAVSGAFGGETAFNDTSTAGNGTFITNGGAVTDPNATTEGTTQFFNTSTAGSGTFTTNGTAVTGAAGGIVAFNDTSTAGNGTFTTNGGAVTDPNGITECAQVFVNSSATAGSGTFTTNGGAVTGAIGGFLQFNDTSTAGNGSITINGGAVIGANRGHLNFWNTSTASNATLIANPGPGSPTDLVGGIIRFIDDSTGGTARVEVFGNGAAGDTTNGNLDISFHNTPGMTIGSIEGSGAVFLGAFKLTVGSNNLSTAFSGVIEDGGMNGGTGGSLTKIGTGTLTLSGTNTYTGGTTVSDGTLLVTNTGGSGTGSGAVQVNAGTLGGTGKIAGAVTVGTGSGPGAVLSPGVIGPGKRPGALIINNLLTFNSDGTYKFELRTSNATADEVVAKGVTINSGALFSFIALGNDVLTLGTVFTVIDNAAATPIAGTFSNLADGSIFIVGGNTFQASYTGGTGNDLTLTVVP
jgi:Passenger-associated-transport-repeat